MIDFVFQQVYDGTINNDAKIGTYCGTRAPETIVSRMNYLHLVLESDDSITGRGFKGNYSFFDVGCGGVIRTLNRTITPPMNEGGDRYLGSQNCRWIIEAPAHKLITLSFDTFNLEGDSSCTFDSVTIYEGYVTSSNAGNAAIGRYCGRERPPLLRSNGNVLTIVFQTDDSLNYEGFTISYDFIDGRNGKPMNFELKTEEA